jgi:hypothetical protein
VGSGELNGDQTGIRVHESLPRFGPPEGNDLRPACLTLLQWCLQQAVLEWQRRLDLAKVDELSRIRALRWRWKNV